MATKCSIIMYHYVRELSLTRYPEIKGMTPFSFKEQISYLSKYYHFVTHLDIIDAIDNKKELPERAVWLTFDDGYADHYDIVYPILDEMGIEGGFFISAKAIQEHKVLDVNKIHFILASIDDVPKLLKDIYYLLDRHRKEYSLKSNEYYFKKLAKANRFDSAETIFIKRLLQTELPEGLRNIMCSYLFEKYVSNNEEVFSRELYMSEEQIKCMARHGMYIGSHGYDHYWENTLSKKDQEEEIDKSLAFLHDLGCDVNNWVMNYPYGAYNDSLIEIIRRKGCKFAVCTEARTADLWHDNIFALPRLDTNDLPHNHNSQFVETA